MSDRPRILLVTHRPFVLHDTVLKSEGFEVVTVHSLAEARAIWVPGQFRLILVEPNGDLREALHFCSESKKVDPTLRFAFMTQQGTYPPVDSCPDDVIMLQYNPEQFVQRVSELVA